MVAETDRMAAIEHEIQGIKAQQRMLDEKLDNAISLLLARSEGSRRPSDPSS